MASDMVAGNTAADCEQDQSVDALLAHFIGRLDSWRIVTEVTAALATWEPSSRAN